MMIKSFETIWETIPLSFGGELVSSELSPLIRSVYTQLTNESLNLSKIKETLEKLFIYLSSTGKTSANCRATDLFFSLSELDTKSFPKELQIILDNISHALHDTFNHPEIAQNFNGLPKQLLATIQKWDTK